jgi:glycosyltransferase involved in cell wall biosynthesis
VRIVWSLPVRGERLTSSRGDLVRARYLIEAMRSDGHEVIVVEDATYGHTQAAVATYRTWLRSSLPRGLSLILRDVGRGVHGCLHGMHVASTARAARADVIIETQVAYAVSGALAAHLTGIPLVLDDCSPSSEDCAFGTGLPALGRAVLTLQARSAQWVVAVSPALAEMLAAEGLPPRKIACVPNGISVDAFTRVVRDGWRTDHGLDGSCVVGFVGSFQPWHRVELLIDAVAALPADCPIHVVLAGEGPGLETVLEAARERGVRERVTAIGAVPADAIPALLAACDIGVLPHSNPYGDPMKLREYAAAGIPSVAPDLDPVREVIEHEATGLLFPPGDVGALAHALVRLAADRPMCRRMGEEARRGAFATGSWTERGRALLARVTPVRRSLPGVAVPQELHDHRPRAGAPGV